MKYTLVCTLLVLSLEFVISIAQESPNKVTGNPNNVNKNIITTTNGSVAITSKNDATTSNPKDVTTKNETQKMDGSSIIQKIKDNKEMLTRTFYVMLGVTSIVVIYFVVRAWRSKRRQNKSRKYGLLATSGADLEMEPLDRDVDDDDEMTMFERQR